MISLFFTAIYLPPIHVWFFLTHIRRDWYIAHRTHYTKIQLFSLLSAYFVVFNFRQGEEVWNSAYGLASPLSSLHRVCVCVCVCV